MPARGRAAPVITHIRTVYYRLRKEVWQMNPRNEWLLRVSLSVVGLGMLLNTGMRKGWIR